MLTLHGKGGEARHHSNVPILSLDFQSKIENQFGSAKLSVNLGLTRAHGSLLLDLYFRPAIPGFVPPSLQIRTAM